MITFAIVSISSFVLRALSFMVRSFNRRLPSNTQSGRVEEERLSQHDTRPITRLPALLRRYERNDFVTIDLNMDVAFVAKMFDMGDLRGPVVCRRYLDVLRPCTNGM